MNFLPSEDMDITQRAICSNPHHVLFKFLPELKNTGHNTRKRVKNFVFPLKDNCNFIPRMLYSSGFQPLFSLYHQVTNFNVGVPPAKVKSKTTIIIIIPT